MDQIIGNDFVSAISAQRNEFADKSAMLQAQLSAAHRMITELSEELKTLKANRGVNKTKPEKEKANGRERASA